MSKRVNNKRGNRCCRRMPSVKPTKVRACPRHERHLQGLHAIQRLIWRAL